MRETTQFSNTFGLTVPNIRKLNPARIRLRMTQRIILHGEPAFLKQSPLGWTGVTSTALVAYGVAVQTIQSSLYQ